MLKVTQVESSHGYVAWQALVDGFAPKSSNESHPQVGSGAQHYCPVRRKNCWYGEIVPGASPMGESKSNGEVERAVQSVHGLARTLKDFLEQQSGIALESRSPLLAWLVEHCSNLLQLFHEGEPHCLHAFERQPWRVEMPSFGECVDFRRRTRHKFESRWSRGVFVGVRVKTTERIVMDETGTYVVQSVRRVPEEQRYVNRLLRSVRGTPWNRTQSMCRLSQC